MPHVIANTIQHIEEIDAHLTSLCAHLPTDETDDEIATWARALKAATDTQLQQLARTLRMFQTWWAPLDATASSDLLCGLRTALDMIRDETAARSTTR